MLPGSPFPYVSSEPLGSVFCRRLDREGFERVHLLAASDGWRLAGSVLMVHEGLPCELDYDLRCDAAWRFVQASIQGRLGSDVFKHQVDRDATGTWHLDGEAHLDLAECLDLDLQFSPATNTLPIRRLSAATGRRERVRAAWLRFPEFSLEGLDQAYTCLAPGKARYEHLDAPSFSVDLELDDHGMVIGYPGLCAALAPAPFETGEVNGRNL